MRSPGVKYGLNSTFIALIPKCFKPESFTDRPISRCALVYKIIAKVISNRIEPVLNENISNEQFGFLFNG